jgi:shikimate dehydrogenase
VSRFVLIGHPVAHSLSPVIHRAAYDCLGVDHEYLLVDAPDAAAVQEQVLRLKSGEIRGANVTVPHKRLALSLADRLDPSAERIGAANTLARDGSGAVVAYNTDALGLADVLAPLAQEAPSAVVIGNGGAALGAVVACQLIGVGEVCVTARAFAPHVDPGEWPHADQFRRLGASTLEWLADSEFSRARVASCRLLLQATSAGMQGADSGELLADLVPWAELAPQAAVYDLVYKPATTPFLSRARARGLTAEGGLSMLVAQAQFAIQIWLGSLPPRQPLMQAARRGLEQRT